MNAGTGTTAEARTGGVVRCRQFQLRVVDGVDRGRTARARGSTLAVGTAPDNELVLSDPLVSRHHLAVRITHRGYWLRDLGSRNGTRLDDHLVQAIALRDGTEFDVGDTRLVLELLEEAFVEPLAAQSRWGAVLGESRVMRTMFAALPRIAGSDATVLLEGETGTGKTVVARELHAASARAAGPFVVVDCSAIPATLIDSALFGHERGAFTGAHAARQGAFESARGGTIFLDEIGELPVELQPKLLRVLEAREVQRIGRVEPIALDVRVIAATNRDLGAMVRAGTFRADLYYRLAVVSLEMPPLHERREDIPGLVAHFHRQLTGTDPVPELLCACVRRAWPGNVRELRNAVERAVVLGVLPGDATAPAAAIAASSEERTFDPTIALRDAKKQATERWLRWYMRELLAYTDGNVSRAARLSNSDRSYLRRLLRRYTEGATP